MKSQEKRQTMTKVQEIKLKKYRWAVKLFVLSLCLSSIFSLISQTIISSLGLFFSILTICIFILISIVFDMIGIAVTSCNQSFFEEKIKTKTKGGEVGLKLCQNAEKVCSFCADMIGDVCGILSGAGGGCIILALVGKIENQSIVILISILISALIAGVTIFGKAIMKDFALKNSNKVILKVGLLIEKLFYRKKRKKVAKNR